MSAAPTSPTIVISIDDYDDFAVAISPAFEGLDLDREFSSPADALAYASLLSDARGWPIRSEIGLARNVLANT